MFLIPLSMFKKFWYLGVALLVIYAEACKTNDVKKTQ